MRTRTRFLLMMTLTVFFFGASAWAQSNNGSVATSDTGQPQVAQPAEGGVNWKGAGIGAGTVAGNLVYVPAKLAYGILGGIAGGAGYALTGGNKQVAETIWRSSLGGDYVLTPNMMTGKEPIYFSGPGATEPAQSTAPAIKVSSSGSNMAQSTGDASASLSSSGTEANASVPATHPIDSGAGPVSRATAPPVPEPIAGANNSANPDSSSHHNGMPRLEAPPLADTSIE